MKTRLAVLFGGRSPEHEVSLTSAYGVITNTDTSLFSVIPIGITREGRWRLFEGDVSLIKEDRWEDEAGAEVILSPRPGGGFFTLSDGVLQPLSVDVVFPVLHGAFGEDGTLQGLFELASVPFVGCGCASSAVCMDKAFTKRVLEGEGIPQAPAAIITAAELDGDFEAALSRAEAVSGGYPIFVKPARTGSSVGVSKAVDRESLRRGVREALACDTKVLCEKFIPGREVEVAVLLEGDGAVTVSPCGEIDPGSEFYDYDTKYKNSTASYFIPARIGDDLARQVRDAAARIFAALDCRGLARVDFFATEEGFVFNEINTLPGFTPISMYPKLMAAAGVEFTELITRLIRAALETN